MSNEYEIPKLRKIGRKIIFSSVRAKKASKFILSLGVQGCLAAPAIMSLIFLTCPGMPPFLGRLINPPLTLSSVIQSPTNFVYYLLFSGSQIYAYLGVLDIFFFFFCTNDASHNNGVWTRLFTKVRRNKFHRKTFFIYKLHNKRFFNIIIFSSCTSSQLPSSNLVSIREQTQEYQCLLVVQKSYNFCNHSCP